MIFFIIDDIFMIESEWKNKTINLKFEIYIQTWKKTKIFYKNQSVN
jgi:hypothetical protein